MKGTPIKPRSRLASALCWNGNVALESLSRPGTDFEMSGYQSTSLSVTNLLGDFDESPLEFVDIFLVSDLRGLLQLFLGFFSTLCPLLELATLHIRRLPVEHVQGFDS